MTLEELSTNLAGELDGFLELALGHKAYFVCVVVDPSDGFAGLFSNRGSNETVEKFLKHALEHVNDEGTQWTTEEKQSDG